MFENKIKKKRTYVQITMVAMQRLNFLQSPSKYSK